MLDRTEDFRSGASPADPADVASPEAVVQALYDVISGPRGLERDLGRLRSLFEPRARFLIGRWMEDPEHPRDVVYEWDLDAFAVEGRQYWVEHGFWESQLVARVERFGNVAHVFSSYVSRVGSEDADPIGRGVNSIQLLFHDGRWWITGIVWDVETEELRLPPELEGGDRGSPRS